MGASLVFAQFPLLASVEGMQQFQAKEEHQHSKEDLAAMNYNHHRDHFQGGSLQEATLERIRRCKRCTNGALMS